MAQPGSLAIDGADPRLAELYDKERKSSIVGEPGSGAGAIRPHQRALHDPSISFEEYHHYALKTREEELNHPATGHETKWTSLLFPSKGDGGVSRATTDSNDKDTGSGVISDAEWTNASRALRTATRGAVFYLITTDILGPFGLPYAFATTGWGPGIALYTVFAGLAGYSGYLLWDCFMGLDSYEYPIRSFGDLGFRLYGPWMRYLFNFLQAIQLILNVGLIVISNGEALSQATKFNLCFIVCCAIWCIIGLVVGQIRTLQKFGWLANFAVWINLICMFITMGGAANSPPNYRAAHISAGASIDGGAAVAPNAAGIFPGVQTSGGLPNTGGFVASVSGAMQAVFAYGGSMVFPEFMAEMKRPNDFLKAMWAAQAFIYFWYMFYGLFMYGYQGQYVINPSYLGISTYSVQTAGNVFAMISAVIAAALYGNIGVKVIYNNIFVELLHAPALTSFGGKIAWVIIIPVYWAIAFVIAAGIPNFGGLTSVVASFCILHFTYTFPPLLSVAYLIKKNAMVSGEGFDPATGYIARHDGGLKRLVRGFTTRWWLNTWNIIYCLAALALGGLGAYSSIEVLKTAYATSVTTSYTCHSPLE